MCFAVYELQSLERWRNDEKSIVCFGIPVTYSELASSGCDAFGFFLRIRSNICANSGSCGSSFRSVRLCAVVLSSVAKEAAFGKVTGVLLALLAPLAIGNAVFLIFGMVNDNAWFVTALSALCVLASAGCCCYLAARYGAPKGLKNTCLVLFAVMAIPSVFFCFLALTFGSIGVNTVVQTAASPDGGFYAEIIDNNQGALGGNTYVVVHEDHAVNAVFFKIEKKPKYVYTGRWGEFQNMQLYWKSEDCLVINDVEYEIR